MTAKNTSLGADNGIGLAMALAIAKEKDHGPLEIIFTSDEEIGLCGANQLDGKEVKGKYLINLDSEEDYQVIIGCNGCTQTSNTIPFKRLTSPLEKTIKITINNLQGGHSGMDIHRKRVNAIKILFYFLATLSEQNIEFNLVSANGGMASNAIPTACEILLACSEITSIKINDLFQKFIEENKSFLKNETKKIVSFEYVNSKLFPLSNECTKKIVHCINGVYNGIKTFNVKFDVSEGSSNLGVITTSDKELVFKIYTRDPELASSKETIS
jgi:dipeptidase D